MYTKHMKRIAVLRGGPSSEYDVSLLSGAAVLDALTASGYDCSDIVITRDGRWLAEGKVKTPELHLRGVDVVFIAMHGSYGEDGQVQRILEQFKIPYTGSASFASALAFNKVLTKQRVCEHGVCVPRGQVLRRHHLKDPRTITRIETTIGTEFFVKPPQSGSSDGARRVRHDEDTYTALSELFQVYDELLLEEFVAGTEATVGVLEGFRGEPLYALPVVEIIPPQEAGFFDRTVKYNGQTREIVPGNFSHEIKHELQRLARLAHETMGCRQYSRSDFLIRNGQIYFLEINTLPGLTSESLFPKAADAVGLSFKELVAHLVETARV